MGRPLKIRQDYALQAQHRNARVSSETRSQKERIHDGCKRARSTDPRSWTRRGHGWMMDPVPLVELLERSFSPKNLEESKK